MLNPQSQHLTFVGGIHTTGSRNNSSLRDNLTQVYASIGIKIRCLHHH